MGVFVTFEGCDCTGKTTQVALLTEYLRGLGHKVFATKEPGGTDFANSVRTLMLSNEIEDPLTELLMISAARRDHTRKILEMMAEGFIVISDRFIDSSYAYQGYGKGLDFDVIKKLTDLATFGLRPDITFLLNMKVDLIYSRILSSKDHKNFYDRKGMDFHSRVRDGFLLLKKLDEARIHIINADDSIDNIHSKVVEISKAHGVV